jgi:ABC transporter substrate binding protein
MFALEPDVIVSWGAEIASGSQKASRAVPIVFAQSIDPVGSGMVASLARPGGNATGFTQFEYSLSGKWPELLKQVAPGITRTAVLRDAGSSGGIGQWAIIQAGASSSGVEAFPRVAGCATPTGSAGHAGATADLKLTFHLDHSAGADQCRVHVAWSRREKLGSIENKRENSATYAT